MEVHSVLHWENPSLHKNCYHFVRACTQNSKCTRKIIYVASMATVGKEIKTVVCEASTEKS